MIQRKYTGSLTKESRWHRPSLEVSIIIIGRGNVIISAHKPDGGTIDLGRADRGVAAKDLREFLKNKGKWGEVR